MSYHQHQEAPKDIFAFLNTTPNILIGSKLPAALAARFGMSVGSLQILIDQYRKGVCYGKN